MNPLTIHKADLGRGARIPLTVLRDNVVVIARFAHDLLAEYQAALAPAVRRPPTSPRPRGQYVAAHRCTAERSACAARAHQMDEYRPDGLTGSPPTPAAFAATWTAFYARRIRTWLRRPSSGAYGRTRAISPVSRARSLAGGWTSASGRRHPATGLHDPPERARTYLASSGAGRHGRPPHRETLSSCGPRARGNLDRIRAWR